MSLINQMLKDLENRTRESASTEAAMLDLQAAIFSNDKKAIKKIWFIGLFIIFILMLFFLVLSHKKTKIPTLVSVPAPVATAFFQKKINLYNIHPKMTESVVSRVHLTPAILTGITLQLEKETTFLRLLMSQDALYRVRDNGKNQLIIDLDNARLVSSLPPINTLNSAIEFIKITNQANGDLRIALQLKAGVELTRLDLDKTGKLPELQVDLFSKDSLEIQKTESIIKLRTDLSMNERYQQALHLSTEGHSNEAMIVLTELLTSDPEYTPARESLAALLLAQGNREKAQQVIKIGLQQRPFYPSYIQLKARMLVEKGKIAQALNLLQLAPPMLKTNPEYHAFIAALYQRQGQSVFAEKLYEQLLNIQPNNATWWMGLGIALENMGKRILAVEAYEKARNSDSLSPELKVYAETRMHHLQE